MCYKGGPRCANEADRRLHKALDKKAYAEGRLADINSLKQRAKDGEHIQKSNGETYTLAGLQKRGTEIARQIAVQQSKIEEAQEQIRLSPEGIERLRLKSEDPNLTPEQRAMAHVDMEAAAAERMRRITENQKNSYVKGAVREQMVKDGFDQATIDECNPDIGNTLFPRTPKEYRKRLASAVNAIQELESKRDTALKGATNEQEREAIRKEYAGKLAEQISDKKQAELDYYSTAPGLAELKSEAVFRKGKMTVTQWHSKVLRYEAHLKDNREKQNDVRLRKLRRKRIITAYKTAGKDPSAALASLKAKENKETDHGRITPERNKPVTVTIMVNEDDYQKAQSQHKASGSTESFQEYTKRLVTEAPQKHFKDKPLADLNAETDQFTNGEWHRQPTSASGLRQRRIDIKMRKMERDNFKRTAGSFKTSMSSIGRLLVTGQDPRVIQNDRSDISNARKTATMENMTAKAKKSA